MAERTWFLDIVQECVNYEVKLQQVIAELKKANEINQALAKKIKELEADNAKPTVSRS